MNTQNIVLVFIGSRDKRILFRTPNVTLDTNQVVCLINDDTNIQKGHSKVITIYIISYIMVA